MKLTKKKEHRVYPYWSNHDEDCDIPLITILNIRWNDNKQTNTVSILYVAIQDTSVKD